MVDLIGSVAAFLTTTSFLPQAWQVYKTQDTHSLSLQMFIMFTVGVALWMVYGIFLDAWPMIIANVITLVLASYILFMKMTESRR